jgi:glutamate synthase (NADPH/NADH) small chain
VTPVPGTVQDLPADLVLLAIGFEGTEDGPLMSALQLNRNGRGGVDCDQDWQTTAPGVFVAGDMHRGASLIVWAIAEGRSAAASIHAYLGGDGLLPAPVHPAAVPLSARQ